jgi:drug/metabolite transporter (DMT)-like permease
MKGGSSAEDVGPAVPALAADGRPTPVTGHAGSRAAILAWLAVCVIWGTTYLAIKVALETVPPFLIGGIRYLLAGSTMIVWLLVRGDGLPPARLWKWFLVTGGLLLGFGNGGVVVAEQWVPSGVAAVVIATTPFWMLGAEAMQGSRERLTPVQWTGLVLGFTGILMLVWPDLERGGASGWRFGAGVLSLQIACAAWSVGSSISRRKPADVSSLQISAMQMLAGGVWMTAAGTLLGEWNDVTFTWRSGAAILYLAYVGGIAGFGAYIYALARLPVSLVSLYAFINPVIAVALGTLLLHEPFGIRSAIAIAIVLTGMAFARTVAESRASE